MGWVPVSVAPLWTGVGYRTHAAVPCQCDPSSTTLAWPACRAWRAGGTMLGIEEQIINKSGHCFSRAGQSIQSQPSGCHLAPMILWSWGASHSRDVLPNQLWENQQPVQLLTRSPLSPAPSLSHLFLSRPLVPPLLSPTCWNTVVVDHSGSFGWSTGEVPSTGTGKNAEKAKHNVMVTHTSMCVPNQKYVLYVS